MNTLPPSGAEDGDVDRRAFVAGAGSVLAAVGASLSTPAGAWTPIPSKDAIAKRDPAAEMRMKITGPFTVAAVGDLIQIQPFTKYASAETQVLIDVLRKADIASANLECNLYNHNTYRGPTSGILANEFVADDIAAMGIDMVTKANNHTMDMGEEGLWECLREADRIGLVHCGAGGNLATARKAEFFQSDKGLVGMVGVYPCDPIMPNNRERPTQNTLQVTNSVSVTRPHFETLKQIAASFSARSGETPHGITVEVDAGGGVTLGNQRFVPSDSPGEYSWKMNETDKAEILHAVKNGKEQSDFFITQFHWHQNRYAFQRYTFDHYPADFEQEMAHACVDNGSDMVIGHGVHTLKGIEIYNGRPICYGVSNFVFEQQLSPVQRPGAEMKDAGELNAETFGWLRTPYNLEALLIEGKYDGGKLVRLNVYPVDLGPGRVGSRLGIPELAKGDVAERILEQVRDFSKPFGTHIEFENGIGVIRLA
jgi:poly-gamma-glutamate capsule biosynthesis protein CapA/YwtB (metallophosphatase superfamily)